MALSLPHNGENPNKRHSILLDVWMRSLLPLEIQNPSLRIVLAIEMTYEDKHRLHLQKLEALKDK